MGIGYKDPLPEGHIEGADLPDDQPVRFVWGKTARQSPHNMAMKNRILNDLRANKHFYHQVPPEDYTDLTMDNSFDQTFKTLRSKFKIQNDEAAAAQNKAREEMKVIRSRRRERKKNVSPSLHTGPLHRLTVCSETQEARRHSQEGRRIVALHVRAGTHARVHVVRGV